MAVLTRSMDPRAAACIDPKVKPIAFIQTGFSAPRHLTLPLDGCLDRYSQFIPADPDVCKNGTIGQFRETGNTIAFRQ